MSDIAASVTIQGLRVARNDGQDDYDVARLELSDRVTRLENLVLDLVDLLDDNGISFDA